MVVGRRLLRSYTLYSCSKLTQFLVKAFVCSPRAALVTTLRGAPESLLRAQDETITAIGISAHSLLKLNEIFYQAGSYASIDVCSLRRVMAEGPSSFLSRFKARLDEQVGHLFFSLFPC